VSDGSEPLPGRVLDDDLWPDDPSGYDATRSPFAPPGYVKHLPFRGEIFYRHHQHPDPDAPTLLLLHGWTASADLQFFTAYEQLAERYSFVAPDHRGHGRGIRSQVPFRLEDAADDAAALVGSLGISAVIVVGYSMGGAIGLHLWNRHPHLVSGLVLEATALEWRESRSDRLKWRALAVMGVTLRAWWYPRTLRRGLRRLSRVQAAFDAWAPWVEGEIHRNEVKAMIEAGKALAAYDARPFASAVDVPTGVLLTTNDHLVKPSKQRALARAINAEVVELAGDHLTPWTEPAGFAEVTRQLVDSVAHRVELASRPAGSSPVAAGRASG
jgi:pimeloyl-ACP methyl ester carboxylesterase